MSHLIRVGVLRGGPGPEHEHSLGSGAAVIHAIQERLTDRYEPHDIFISRSGQWKYDGEEMEIGELPARVDLVFNALRGHFGEDGKIQSLLQSMHVPQTGSDTLASVLGINKLMAKKIFKDNGLPSPYFQVLSSEEIIRDPIAVVRKLFQSLLLPAIVKPVSGGSQLGMSVVCDYGSLPDALVKAARQGREVILEEYVQGEEASCLVIENFRGQDLYTLPPIEIRRQRVALHKVADHHHKSEIIIPSSFSAKIKAAIEATARKIHGLFGLRHYSKSDFIIHPKRGLIVLEVNTGTGFTDNSLLPKALHSVGSDLAEFVEHVLEMTRGR